MSVEFEIPDWMITPAPPPTEPAEVDPHRVEALVNRFIAAKQDALFNAPDAFYRHEGAGALHRLPFIKDRLIGLKDRLIAEPLPYYPQSIPNDELTAEPMPDRSGPWDRASVEDLVLPLTDSERAMLGTRLDAHIAEAMDGIDRHVAAQRDVFNRRTIGERQAFIRRAAELEHDNDDKIDGLAEAHASAAQELARMNGEPEAPAMAVARSAIWRTAIDRHLEAGNAPQGISLFDKVSDRLTPADRLSLDAPLQAAGLSRKADQWLERESPGPDQPLTERLAKDPNLSPLEKALVRVKLDVRDSLPETRRIATVMGLDDRLGTTAHAVAAAPAAYKNGSLATLADAYDEAREPDRAVAVRRLAVQEPVLLTFAQATVERQRSAIDALPDEVQPAARAIQRQQAEAFAKDPFTAGTTLYSDIGKPAPIGDIDDRVVQARTIAERRGMPVAPYSRAEIDGLRRTLADGASAERATVLEKYEALPADMQRALAPLLWPQTLSVREAASDIPTDDPALHSNGAETAQADESPPDAPNTPPDAEPPEHWNQFRLMTEEEWRAREAAQSGHAGAPPTEPPPGSPEYQSADAEAKRIVAEQQVPIAGGISSGATEPAPGSPDYQAADASARRIVGEEEASRGGETAPEEPARTVQRASYAPAIPGGGLNIGKTIGAIGSAIARAAPRAIAGAAAPAGAAALVMLPASTGVTRTVGINDRLRMRTVAPERNPHIEHRVDDGWFGSGIGARWEEIPGVAKAMILPDGRHAISLDLDRLKGTIDDGSMSDLLNAPDVVMARPPRDDDDDDDHDDRRRGRKPRRERHDNTPPPPIGHNGPPGPLEPQPPQMISSDARQPSDNSNPRDKDDEEKAAKRREIRRIAEYIGAGHAVKEHLEIRREYPGMSQFEYIDLIEYVMNNPTIHESFPRSGREAYWDKQSKLLVIKDPSRPDLGTAFKRLDGPRYIRNMKDE
jgi:hypothetical protein